MPRNSDASAPPAPRDSSLVSLLRKRADWHPDRTALSYVEDDDGGITALTYGELYRRFTELSQRLSGAGAGERALLLYPAGLEFVVAFLACQASRIVPVPTCYPKPGRAMPRLDAAAEDCGPSLLLADRATLAGLDEKRLSPVIRNLPRIATDERDSLPTSLAPHAALSLIQPSDLGLLQYTSGSTSHPKGVMVSHANLMANLESICQSFGLPWSHGPDDRFTHSVFWLPAFHDMGLIGGILETLYLGGHAELMSPRSFLSKPIRWLELIARTGATVSGAPNFAYELCVERISSDEAAELDLSGWEIAFCGAEPISAETLDRFTTRFTGAGFRPAAFLPCYGLAEATLLAASEARDQPWTGTLVDRNELTTGSARTVDADRPGGSARRLVSCGAASQGTTIKIVDPQTCRPCASGEVGEIWLQGPSIAQGYWQRDEENARTFHATISGDRGAGEFLRTGDLGFLHDGNLHVTGRCKDVIIVRGRNHYPNDIESTVRRALGDELVCCVAVATGAFASAGLSLVIEVSRHTDDANLPDLVRQARRGVIDEHEIDARQIVLARPGTIPMTTSGKVQRSACRGLLESNELVSRYEWSRSVACDDSYAAQLPALPQRVDADSIDDAAAKIEAWLMAWLVVRCGAEANQVGPQTPIADHGLDSMSAVELTGEIEDWLGVALTPLIAMTYPTPETLAVYLAEEFARLDSQPAASV